MATNHLDDPQAEQEQSCWQLELERRGFQLYGINVGSSEEVNELCRILSITSLQKKSQFRAFLKRLQSTAAPSERWCYQVMASIEDARLCEGVRAAVYKKADDCSAHYSTVAKPISYGQDEDYHKLFISLYFEKEEEAFQFSRLLRNWEFDHPNSSVRPNATLATRCKRPIGLTPVTFQDYDPEEADDAPPCTTSLLANVQDFSLVFPAEPAEFGSNLIKYQTIESSNWLSRVGAYKLHLKDKTISDFKSLRNNDNNMLAASWIFHQHFDGLNLPDMPHRVPLVAVKPLPLGRGENNRIFQEGKWRFRVNVQVECFTKNAANTLYPFILFHDAKVAENCISKKWRISLYPEDPDLFIECLQWKYDDSVAKWNKYQQDLNEM